MYRRVLALVLSPIILGLIVSIPWVIMSGSLDEAKNTLIFVVGMTVAYCLLLVFPPYGWLIYKAKYTLQAINKVGMFAGGFVGFTVAILSSHIWVIIFGIVSGFVGARIFHYIHGEMAPK